MAELGYGFPILEVARSLARNSDSAETSTTAWVRDLIGEPSNNYSLFKCGFVSLGQGLTRYLKAVGTAQTATEADAQVGIGLPTEIYAMKIYLADAIPSSETITITVRKNTSDSTLTKVITGPTTAGAVVDVSGNVFFGRKYDGTMDVISVKCVTSAATGTLSAGTVSLLARVPGSNYKPVSTFALGSTDPGVGNYSCGGEFKTFVRARIALANTLSDGSIPVPSIVLHSFLQGENTAWPYINESTANQITGNYNVYLPLESAFAFAEETSNTVFTGYLVFSDRDCGNDTGTWAPLVFSSIDQAQNTTLYMGGYGFASANATESIVKIAVPAGKCWKLRARSSDLLPAGQTAIITVRRGGSNEALSVTLTDAIQIESDETNFFTTTENELISISCVTSAAAGTLSYVAVLEIDRNR
jgi:hypothetical protein